MLLSITGSLTENYGKISVSSPECVPVHGLGRAGVGADSEPKLKKSGAGNMGLPLSRRDEVTFTARMSESDSEPELKKSAADNMGLPLSRRAEVTSLKAF